MISGAYNVLLITDKTKLPILIYCDLPIKCNLNQLRITLLYPNVCAYNI